MDMRGRDERLREPAHEERSEEDEDADDDDDVDDENGETYAEEGGPLSHHVAAGGATGTTKSHHETTDEVAYLRLENALLKKKVKTLERVSRGEKRSMKLVVDESEMQRINELLKKAEDAKADALSYTANTSRDKLGQDVKVLQSILKKAKAERHAFKKKIKAADEKLLLERQKIEKEEIRFQVDREIFAKILKDDRDAYKYEVNLLVQKMTDLQKEKHELFVWTKTQHERHLQEIRKLTRAVGRTRKLVDDHKTAREDVLNDLRLVKATVCPPTKTEFVSGPPPAPVAASVNTIEDTASSTV